ncbi:ABC transporter ATP-binding protein [Hufsiella ginkgonis]|uniref:ATP-binding cassette domain-containing protein n=1 Tax=Hufsiella ginkgonis TaxID=2695274 RepID=A0A7K1XSC9_9SPHI|nr:ABC transporter ATP-binding protein [Hufsiella ginkgonis]MXV13808.1 ATP-binding cassette domain-containing protein [Hufsiella ginkgonis]
MLQFSNFQKSYNQFQALSIPDMAIHPGIYWVKGVNGSGKSTLLKSVAGILSFKGEVLLNQVSLTRQPVAYRKLVNFAEAEPLFPAFLTGTEMIRLFAAAKFAPAGQEERYLDDMQMRSYIHKPVGTYSSGMLKKLSLLLAFLGKPELILLDEPLITIDNASLGILHQWIAAKYADGASFLLTSHQALDAEMFPDARELLVAEQTLHQVN